jgi:hypothetical protein
VLYSGVFPAELEGCSSGFKAPCLAELLLPKGVITMARDLLKNGEGRFFRGNLHCHSNRSDGLWEPEEVVGAYRDAGYDFVCL